MLQFHPMAEKEPIQYREGDTRTNIELLTNHAKVLLYILDNPTITGVMMAKRLGVTGRTVRQVISELRETRIIEIEKVTGPGTRGRGGTTLYKVNPKTIFPSTGIGNLELGQFANCVKQIVKG